MFTLMSSCGQVEVTFLQQNGAMKGEWPYREVPQ
jgi:hypothetical protein